MINEHLKQINGTLYLYFIAAKAHYYIPETESTQLIDWSFILKLSVADSVIAEKIWCRRHPGRRHSKGQKVMILMSIPLPLNGFRLRGSALDKSMCIDGYWGGKEGAEKIVLCSHYQVVFANCIVQNGNKYATEIIPSCFILLEDWKPEFIMLLMLIV